MGNKQLNVLKKIVPILLFMLFALNAPAQLKLNDTEYFTAAIFADPVASIKEKGLNIGAEIELISFWGYVRASAQTFPGLGPSYLDFVGSLGINLRYGHFSPFRFYGGIRGGAIYRGKEFLPYPTYGIEAGIDLYTRGNLFFGLRATHDYRGDFKYYNNPPEFKTSGYLRIGLKF